MEVFLGDHDYLCDVSSHNIGYSYRGNLTTFKFVVWTVRNIFSQFLERVTYEFNSSCSVAFTNFIRSFSTVGEKKVELWVRIYFGTSFLQIFVLTLALTWLWDWIPLTRWIFNEQIQADRGMLVCIEFHLIVLIFTVNFIINESRYFKQSRIRLAQVSQSQGTWQNL